MKHFLIGIFISCLAVLLVLPIWGVDKVILITGGIGLFFLVLSMIAIGSLVSGDRMRANFTSESVNERHKRADVSTRFMLIGLPNLVLAVCLLYFM